MRQKIISLSNSHSVLRRFSSRLIEILQHLDIQTRKQIGSSYLVCIFFVLYVDVHRLVFIWFVHISCYQVNFRRS